MKKLLIISYYYPPANFVGGQRTAAWAKYLHEFGYYPIIITRQWNDNQTDLVDKVEYNELEIEYNETHEVHRLPYKRSLRDKLSNFPKFRVFQKALTLKELIFSNYKVQSLPYANFYSYCKELIQKNSDIKTIITSGTPFQSFSIGHQLKKDFPHIHWIPDYRDKWTNNESNPPQGKLQKLIHKLESRSEQKWTKNSSAFITTSERWKTQIGKLINQPGWVIANGFDINKKIDSQTLKNDSKSLNLLYVGSIYSSQDFSILFQTINELNQTDKNIQLTFLGSYSNEQGLNQLKNLTNSIQVSVNFVPKIKYEEVVNYVNSADVLILTEYKDYHGCIPVKAYDYYNSNKPILLCPSDQDLMENFLLETESGYIANSVEECKAILLDLLEKKKTGQDLIGPRNTKNATFYSRRFQTQLLAEGLDKL